LAGVARRQVLSLRVQRKHAPTLQAFGFPLASGQKPVGTGTRLRLKQPPRPSQVPGLAFCLSNLISKDQKWALELFNNSSRLNFNVFNKHISR